MKINSVHLASFGKFKNYTLDFGDRLNIVFGENEKGKTTIMAFIRMMFYGTSGKSGDIDKNLRKKYMPFDSDIMAGSITFTHKGVSYTLERVFKASNTADKLKLINHSTGEITSLSGKNNIGYTFFGLSDAAFEKSVYIGNMSIPNSNEEADGELNSRLSNIATSLDENVSLESVKSKLLKAKEALMSRSGRIGAYDKASKQLEDTKQLLREAKEREGQTLTIEQEITQKQSLQDIATKDGERLFELLKNAKKLNLKATLEKYLDSCEIIDSLEERLTLKDGTTADEDFLKRLKASYNEAEDLKKALSTKGEAVKKASDALDQLKSSKQPNSASIKDKKASLENDLSSVRIEIASLCSQIEGANRADYKNGKGKGYLALIIAGIMTVASSVGLFFINSYLSVLALIGIGLIVCGVIVKKKKVSHSLDALSHVGQLNSSLNLAKTKESTLLAEIELLNSQLIDSAGSAALIDSKAHELIEYKEALVSAKELELVARNQLNHIVSELKGDYENVEEAISSIEKTLSLISAEKVKLSMSYELTGCLSKEEAKSRLNELNTDPTISGISSDELDSAQKRIKEISDQKSILSSDIATLKQRLGGLLFSGEPVAVLEKRIEEIKQNLSSQKDFCDSIDIAMQTLDEAFGELRHNFSYLLEGKTAKIFSSLTGGVYDSVNISKNFEIGVKESDSFGTREWQYLSLGTAQQAYFALRLALAELLDNEGSTLPLLLDDSFSEYDDTRAKTAVEFLKQYSENAQIILFTCHSRIIDMAKTLDSDIKNL